MDKKIGPHVNGLIIATENGCMARDIKGLAFEQVNG